MRVSSKEYTDYVVFYQLFPWSYDAAFLGCLISNLMRGKNKEAASIADFMPADVEEIDPIDKAWDNLRALAKDIDDGKS